MTQNLKELAKANLKKKKNEENSTAYWLQLEAKKRKQELGEKEEEVEPKESNGQKFKAKNRFSKSFLRSCRKIGLSPFLEDVRLCNDTLKSNRKKRKAIQRKLQKEKLKDNQIWRRAHPRSKKKGGKNKGKSNKQQLEGKKEVTKAA